MSELDELLSQPLPDVEDSGFSSRVAARLHAERRRRWWTAAAAVAACLVLAVLLLPLKAIGAGLGATLPQIAGNWAVNLAMGLIVLSFLAERELSRL
jgi:hypothetical protein